MKKRIFVIILAILITLTAIITVGCSDENGQVETNINNAEANIEHEPEEIISETTQENASQTDPRLTILRNSFDNAERNKLLIEDLEYFKNEFPKRHINAFSIITKDEFEQRIDALIADVDKSENGKIFIKLCEIIAAVQDGHSGISIWDGNSYPLVFYIFENDLYVVNADNSLADILHSRVIKINNTDISEIIPQLKKLIPRENEYWGLTLLPRYFSHPVYMYDLGIIPDKVQTVFTVEKNGAESEITVPIFGFGKDIDFIVQEDSPVTGTYSKNYDYQYIADSQALLFIYNACAEMQGLTFNDFNRDMFNYIADKEVKKIIIDLRSNSGGNSEIINPFIQSLSRYISNNPETKVYILVGRQTYSSGMFAIYQIMDAVPHAITIGEPTGGALDRYGEVRSFNLPNSQLPVYYSTKLFEFSKMFNYKNSGIDTFIPDVEIIVSFSNYIMKKDVVLNYALND